MSSTDLYALAAAAGLAAIHIAAAKFHFLRGVPRNWLLSTGGGVSVAYVFIHLLPEVAEGQEALAEATEGVASSIERHSYLLALLGLAVFYGIERASVRSRRREANAKGVEAVEGRHTDQATDLRTFALSIASFAVYNALIGYLLVRRVEETGTRTMALFAIAMAVHFVVNDFGLREHHRHRYEHLGRWILAVAVLAGWAVALVTEISEAAIAVLIAFIGGGVVLNVLKEELPEERDSNFWAFGVGAAAYTAVLLAL